MAPSGTKARASAEATRVLVVDDEPALRRSLARTLMTGGFSVDTAESGAAALDLLRARAIDVVLLDRAMPEMDGLAALARMRQLHPTVEVVMMTAAGDPEGAGAALRAGAYDVVQKAPASPGLLCLPVERAAERRRLSLRVRALEQRIAEHDPLGELIGASTRMQELHRRAFAAAPSASTVLVLGERGTGKELLARAVHRRSNRGREPLQVLNLSAVPEDQVEAELFGGGPGRPGAFALADGGTLLLDEVGDLPVAAQARLLRAVTHGEIRAAGAAESRTVDVRVISTSHADLRDRVAAGLFREDLFYRLSVIPLEIPPLRRRREDIALLAYHFLQRCAARGGRKIQRISAEALRKLREHPWPGNVRELEAAIEHAAVMAQGDALLPGDLPLGQPPPGDDDADPALELVTGDLAQLSYGDAKERAVDAFDRVYLERLMQRSAGNVSEAARLAGMDRSNFRRLLKKVRGRPSGDRARRAGGAPTPQGEDRCVEDDGED